MTRASDLDRSSSTSRESTLSTVDAETTKLERSDKRFLTKAAESSQKETAVSQLAAQRASDPDVRSFAQQLVSEHRRMSDQLGELAERKGVALEHAMVTAAASAMRAANPAGMPTSRDTSTNSGIAQENGAPRATGAAGTAGTGAATGMATNESTATSGMTSSTISADAATDRHFRRLADKTGEEFDKEYVDLVVDAHEESIKMFEKAAEDSEDSEVRAFAAQALPSLRAHLEHANSLLKTSIAAE